MLTIETGSGLPDAESYASIAAADVRCVSQCPTPLSGLRDAESCVTQSGVA